MLEQVGDPLGVFSVGFLSLNGLDEFRMADYHMAGMAGLLQNVVDWKPVLSGGFHTDIRTVIG